MWIFIAILIVIILYLIVLGSNRARTEKKESKNTNNRILIMARRVTELTTERDELKESKKQEVHNNVILTDKNRELTHLLTQVADMSVTYMIGHEKEALGKIRELTRDCQSDVNSH